MDTMLALNTATLDVDFKEKYLAIKWDGKVDIDEYKEILTKAIEIVDVHDIRNVIINRLALDELSTECRVWMKGHFLKHLVKPVIPKLSRVATIEAKSTIGQIYTNTISKSVGLVYPKLRFKSFKSETDALKWIEGVKKETVKVEEPKTEKKEAQNEVQKEVEELEKDPGTLLDKFYRLFFKS